MKETQETPAAPHGFTEGKPRRGLAAPFAPAFPQETAVKKRFQITDEASAAWYLRKLGAVDAEIEAVKGAVDSEIEELQAASWRHGRPADGGARER